MVPAVVSDEHPPAPDEAVGSRRRALLTWSWLMMPVTVFVTFPLTFAVMAFLLGLRDLEGSEPMSEQGLYGWLVLVLGLCVLLAPQGLGVVLAARARRLGAGGVAVAATVVNALILVSVAVASVVGSLGQ